MAAVSGPYGLKPIGKLGGGPYAGPRRGIPLTTNNTTGIFCGDPVHIASGVITACAATPTTTQGANTPIGVFVGCRYYDATAPMGMRYSEYLPANAVTAGYKNILVFVEDDPDCLFQVQADGAVTTAAIGKNCTLGNFGAGSTTTGNSKVQLVSGGIATTNTLAVRIVDVVNNTAFTPAGSAPGDAYTDVIVAWTPGVHAYRNATGA